MDALRNRLQTAITAGPPARFVALFGSAAKGTMHAGSDVDLAWLPTDAEVPLARELTFQVELTQAAGREVDLMRLDRVSTLCRSEVARTGVLLAGERSDFVRFRAEAIGEFLDFEPALRDAGERFRRRLATGGRRTRHDRPGHRRLPALREHAERLRRRRPARAEDLRHDPDLQDALSMSLLVAVQAALDIALHIASDEGLGVPATYAEGFSMLADHGYIDQETSRGLGAMAALRNRIAHGYASVDFERIWTELPAGMDALDAFSTAIARHLGGKT